MFIQTELTPNPLTIKFLPGRVVMEQGTVFYESNKDIKSSPLAKRLFGQDGVESVFLGNDFISVTKKESSDWQILKPIILGAITDHYNANEEIYISNLDDQKDKLDKENTDTDIVKQIKELIETRVRPAVAMDGGDIIYDGFKEGVVYLKMQGACSGCPSSTATLKMGIENMLKHYVPEVKEVRPVDA
tara:strand:- start:1248 stop:1811 length:564 start_codon:yes stop_codon:yes gene_type:complete